MTASPRGPIPIFGQFMISFRHFMFSRKIVSIPIIYCIVQTRRLSGSCQAVVRQLSGNHQAVIRQLSGSNHSVIRQLSSSCQAVIRQFSGSRQAVNRQLTGSCRAVLRQSSIACLFYFSPLKNTLNLPGSRSLEKLCLALFDIEDQYRYQ